MFSSILRPSRSTRRASRTSQRPFLSPYRNITSAPNRRTSDGQRRRPTADYDAEVDDSGSEDEGEEDEPDQAESIGDDYSKISGEDGLDDTTPLLPMFSAAHLDVLPVFELTHAIRILVISKVDTTLSWEQLRSPQISQFLLRPLQLEIRSNHFSAATEYALMANCLQFNKEVNTSPGNSGTSKTRAMVCELLAIRLLREYSMRGLIDAMCYDFNPLQGQEASQPGNPTMPAQVTTSSTRRPYKIARISCLEVAIRTQAKRLLAHPQVVQLLEAIWSGSIVFYAAADSMHRQSASEIARSYGTAGQAHVHAAHESTPGIEHDPKSELDLIPRRTVTLYNPRDASIFKLSRLRVPRYRNLLSTFSFAVLLALFLAVLIERSLEITPLEMVFWFWAAGYMLDEIVGFNEQGFSLYIASFWNTFDLGILLILLVHLCLRVYGIIMPDTRKHTVANLAYDVLAADAILLFPRLFSVLDHYRYFSQLLIAFRMMAVDLLAVFVLIIISCSGFFVALTLSFSNEGIDTPSSVAYALLQILMGFTPAAWDRWSGYNALGKTILTLFLFICHFLVVTILITVLTNSFMAIAQNANEEHQYVFAVNTLSMVKSDSLFAYVAPLNIFAWILTPLRYFLPFRKFLKTNRTAIKLTHFPILLLIYTYEKSFLQISVADVGDDIQRRGRSSQLRPPKRARAPSIATVRQDRALEAVFSRPFDTTLRSAQQSQERKTSNVVSTWMKNIDEVLISPPIEDVHGTVRRVDSRSRRRMSRLGSARRNFTRSVASDPEDFRNINSVRSPKAPSTPGVLRTPTPHEVPDNTDADGDDELATDDNEDDKMTLDQESTIGATNLADPSTKYSSQSDYFMIPRSRSTLAVVQEQTGSGSDPQRGIIDKPASDLVNVTNLPPNTLTRPSTHMRNVSSATVVYKPEGATAQETLSQSNQSAEEPTTRSQPDRFAPLLMLQSSTPRSGGTPTGQRTPKRQDPIAARMRPIMPPKTMAGFQSDPNLAGVFAANRRAGNTPRHSTLDMDLVSDLGDNKAIGGGYVGALPASVAAQMRHGGRSHARDDREGDRDMVGRLMMARMNTLEEGFREVVHEMRDHMRRPSRSQSRSKSREKAARPAKQHRPTNLRRGDGRGSARGSKTVSEHSTEQSQGSVRMGKNQGDAFGDDSNSASRQGQPE